MKRILLAILASLAPAAAAYGQNSWPTPGGQTVGGVVPMMPNAAGIASPSGSSTIPPGTSITGNATGSTGAVTGTLAGAAGRTTYICGFTVSSTGGTATSGPVTVAGLTGSSMVFQLTNNVASTATNFTQTFAPCVPASAVNTAITVATTANGTATAVDVNAWGFQF